MNDRLSVTALTKSYGTTQALRGVSIAAARGEVHAVIGENGAGKSTLMKILGGATTADSGKIVLDGAMFAPTSPRDARRSGIAMVHQELALCPHLSVWENVVLGAEPTRGPFVDRTTALARTRAALVRVLGEEPRIDARAPIASLSTADRQVVELARAVVGPDEARVVILDEPTSSLGHDDAQRLFALVRRLAASGTTVLYVSHFLEEVAALCDRFTVLRDGESVLSGDIAGTSLAELVEKMAGRDIIAAAARAPETGPKAPGAVAIAARHVRGRSKPLDASFEVRRGEVFGIAGLVGAGRTELLRVLFGLDRLSGGELEVLGRRGFAPASTRVRDGVGMVAEDRKQEGLALGLSIADNVTMSDTGIIAWPALLRASGESWMTALHVRARDGSQTVQELSGGNQQKVLFARLLQRGAEVVLLDEPTRGVDVHAKAQIFALIADLARNDKAVVVVSSYLPDLLATCDRIAVMKRGVLGEARAASTWTEASLLAEATGATTGLAAEHAP